MRKYLISSLLFLFVMLNGYSQNIVTDSLFINFIPDTLLPFNLNISNVTDNRSGSPKFISYSQKKKFILIPVDQEISTNHPLAEEIHKSFNTSTGTGATYELGIDYFKIERANGRFSNPFILRADIPVYLIVDTTKEFLGTLSYNLPYKPTERKTPKTETCQTMLHLWHTDLKLDLISIESSRHTGILLADSFIEKEFKKPHFLHVAVGGVVGLDFIQVDAEIYFTRPETERSQRYLANIVRYQNNPELELFAFGKRSQHYTSRINDNWNINITTNALVGLNKWKVTQDKTLYHLFNFSISSNQSLSFDKFNRTGWKLDFGLFENLYYVIGMRPKFQIGLYLSTGYKF